MPATRGNVTRVVSATGTVNPELTIIVGAYVSGTIRQLFCDYNTIVRAGQICAKIDPHPYQAILDQYQGQLARDQGLLAEAEANLTRYQQLAAQNSIARQQAEDQAFLVEQDKGTVQLDEGLVEGAKINLAYTDIVAPVDGVVVSRAVTQGQTVASGFQTPTLFLIATDLAKMQVDTNASESDVGGVKEGNPASFSVDAFPKRIFSGKVVQLRNSPQTVQNVVTFDAVISVPNNDLALLPGMTASTRIVIAERDGVIRVPNQALRYMPGGLPAASPSGTSTTTPQPKTPLAQRGAALGAARRHGAAGQRHIGARRRQFHRNRPRRCQTGRRRDRRRGEQWSRRSQRRWTNRLGRSPRCCGRLPKRTKDAAKARSLA